MKFSEIIRRGHRDRDSVPKTYLNHLGKKIFEKTIRKDAKSCATRLHFVNHKFS